MEHTGQSDKGTRLLIHTRFGVVIFETDDQKEIIAAVDAIADVRRKIAEENEPVGIRIAQMTEKIELKGENWRI